MNRLADVNATDDNQDELTGQGLTGEVDDVDESDDEVEPLAAPPSLGWILTIGGILGFIASFMLAAERIEMLQDPNYMPTCSIDSVLQCSTVMGSTQGELFGFPNPLIGLVAFPVLIVAGVLALARVWLPSWFWRWLLVGATYGLAFVGWLIGQSLYEIRALCPYCIVVWVCVLPIFWRTLAFTLAGGHVGQAAARNGVVQMLERFWWAFTLASYAVVATLVLTAFPYYFF